MLIYEIPKNTLNDWLKNYDKYKTSKNVLRKKYQVEEEKVNY